MSTKPSTCSQGASTGEGTTLDPSAQPRSSEGLTLEPYLHQLASSMDHWQHLVFNAAHQPNRSGLCITAAEIQTAAYEVRILLGMSVLEAKIAAGMTLTDEEREEVAARVKRSEELEEEQRRKQSVAEFQRGLQGGPAS